MTGGLLCSFVHENVCRILVSLFENSVSSYIAVSHVVITVSHVVVTNESSSTYYMQHHRDIRRCQGFGG
jgi:hypothetical protein